LLPVFRAFPTEGIRSVPALFALKSLPGLSGRRAFWPKIREFAASVRTVEISMPLDQIRATKFHDELEQLHGELDQVRRDGWDSGARVSVLEGRIAHIVGILLGLCALGVVVPLSSTSSAMRRRSGVIQSLWLLEQAWWRWPSGPSSISTRRLDRS
jgi:hypothetical protein